MDNKYGQYIVILFCLHLGKNDKITSVLRLNVLPKSKKFSYISIWINVVVNCQGFKTMFLCQAGIAVKISDFLGILRHKNFNLWNAIVLFCYELFYLWIWKLTRSLGMALYCEILSYALNVCCVCGTSRYLK